MSKEVSKKKEDNLSTSKPKSSQSSPRLSSKKIMSFPVSNSDAAGIDVGSRSHAVSKGLGSEDSKEFGVFTENLHELCKWLHTSGVKSVAMESTGIYWKQLFLMLQSYGMEVYLVNATYTKNIKSRKPSDLADSQWIWKLHSVGLLPASYQPDYFTEELRSYVRHRKKLIEGASHSINRMQKCLVLMNLQLPVVLSDITGKSGQAIIQAILDGERNGQELAKLADPRVKASKTEIAKALTGFWKDNHLFALQQHWEMYHFHQKQIQAVEEKIDDLLQKQVEKTGQNDLAYPPIDISIDISNAASNENQEGDNKSKSRKLKKKRRAKNAPDFELEKYAYQLSDGVDLLQINGIGFSFVLTFLSEVGMDLSQFPSSKHFVSWLCLCPNNKVSGGKVISSKTKKNKHRLKQAFKDAAISIARNKDDALAVFYRRMAATKGKGTAITATARKLAIIVYNMVEKGQPYQPQKLEDHAKQIRSRRIKHIQRTINALNIDKDELIFAQ